MKRLFLLYFPGYYDGDEIIGIYDDVPKLKSAYERVIRDQEHYYEVFLDNPRTTIEEFDRDSEKFEEVCREQNRSTIEVLKEFMEEYTRKEKANKNSFNRFNVMHLEEKLCMIYSGICDIIQLLEC